MFKGRALHVDVPFNRAAYCEQDLQVSAVCYAKHLLGRADYEDKPTKKLITVSPLTQYNEVSMVNFQQKRIESLQE